MPSRGRATATPASEVNALIATATLTGARVLVPADFAFYGSATVGAVVRAGADVSVPSAWILKSKP